ncbi:peroxiredoxin-like family protein [Campylobacterota bacterium DY0563]
MSRLIDAIEEYKQGFKEKVPFEVQELMLNATKELEKLRLSKNSKKVGEKLENEAFFDINSKEVNLYDFFEDKDFLIVSFYRGAWCPYCNLELKSLQAYLNEFKKANASLISISPQTPDFSLTTKEKNELEFEVLSDIENKVAKKYGLVFSLADELKPIYKKFGIDIPSSNSDYSYELPMPATFVIDKTGTIIYSFVNEDYTKREEPQNILDIIKKN